MKHHFGRPILVQINVKIRLLLLDILPEDPIPLPSTWTQRDQERYLKGTEIIPLIPDSEAQFKDNFLKHKSKFTQTASLSEDQLLRLFHFAGSLISAYSFNERADDDSATAMVPLADTLNHRTGCNNARLYYGPDELSMIAIKDCPAGEQLFNTYGDLGNRELLLRYGFTDGPNPFHGCTFDPIDWLRPLVAEHFRGQGVIAEADDPSFALFDKYDGVLDNEIRFNETDSMAGLKPLLDWVYLLSRPIGGKLPKPQKSYPLDRDFIKLLLQKRMSLYDGSTEVDKHPWSSKIKTLDLDILRALLNKLS